MKLIKLKQYLADDEGFTATSDDGTKYQYRKSFNLFEKDQVELAPENFRVFINNFGQLILEYKPRPIKIEYDEIYMANNGCINFYKGGAIVAFLNEDTMIFSDAKGDQYTYESANYLRIDELKKANFKKPQILRVFIK